MTVLGERNDLYTRDLYTRPSRRQFMIGAAGLTFAIVLDPPDRDQAEAAAIGSARVERTMSPWVTIASDGTISIMSPATEMGQGSMTSLPLILAEELDAEWSKVRIVPAPPIEALYGNPGFGGIMYTAGSNAVRSYYMPLRKFGAQVRRVLLDNAATYLGVARGELTTEPSVVVHAKTGRRLSYGEIARFAEVPAVAPDIATSDLKTPGEFRLIGRNVMRVELPTKVDGSAQYSIDVQVPEMVYGAVLRAPVEGSAPDRIDDARAKAIVGVIKIVRLPYGVGVLAETPWAALEAREALLRAVTWTRSGKAWGFDSDRGIDAFAAAARDLASPAIEWSKAGDARAEIARAASVIEAEYRCDYAYHAQMEPLNATASVAPSGDAVEIWCGTQSQTLAAEACARALGIPRDRVRLNYTLLGGGFGRRGHRDEEFIIDAVLMSNDIKRPVKVLWTREDDVRNGRLRPLSGHFLRAGLDSSGRLVAWHHRVAGDRVAPFMDPVRFEQTGKDFILMLGTDVKGYDIAHQLIEQIYEDTGVRTSALRGIGFTANKFATEAFVDEIARVRGVDPVSFRLELLSAAPRARKAFERVVEMADPNRKRDDRGLGFAFIDYSGSLLGGAAEVSVDRRTGEIKVHDFWCTIDCGIAVQPDNVIAQMESSIVYGLGMALSERISVKDGAIEQSNFYDYQVMRMSDVPQMHIEIVASDNHPTGVGQMATPLVAPAISSAVAQLTGVRLRHTPMTPDRVKKALG
jgi:isoquinoline 1-oxidoreductase subunit beta